MTEPPAVPGAPEVESPGAAGEGELPPVAAEPAPAAAPPPRRFRLPLRPFEIYTFASTLAIVAFLRYHGLRIDWTTVDYSLVPMVKALPRMALVGLGLQLVAHLVRRRSFVGYLRQVARPASLWLWARVWFAAMLMTYSYKWLKVCIPLFNYHLFDDQLWRLDRFLHLGVSPSIFAVELTRGTPVAGWLDTWYGWWITSVLFALAYFFSSTDLAQRRRFALACALLWTLGATTYALVPALGPCYYAAAEFEPVADRMPSAIAGQAVLWGNYTKMLAGRTGQLYQFNPVMGVAAMPSLHVGAHFLFFLWARRYERRLALLLALATGLTLFASVLTGWHYAVDGYAGMLLAWICYRLALRFEPPEPAPA